MRLTQLKGIGEKTEETFKKLGIGSVEELLEYYPRDFEVFTEPISISQIGYKPLVSIKGAFLQKPSGRKAGRLMIVSANLKDEFGGSIKAVWFNAPFMERTLPIGKTCVLRGRVSRKHGILEMDQPKIYSIEEYQARIGVPQPIYPLTKGISNPVITKAVKNALESEAFDRFCTEDVIPQCIRDEMGLCSRKQMIRGMHFPKDKNELKKAMERASFEEIFLFLMAMKQSEAELKRESSFIIPNDEKTEKFLESLPFELTQAQKNVIKEINMDMSSGRVMNRLIQGDVGSGKTIVAISACMNAAFAGGQAALMAPTEVLASQHYENITSLFKKNGIDLKVGLLTGSMSALEKRVVYDAIEDDRLDIVVGTHALFQEKVKFHDLSLVITDEQHRFGIKQRQALADKGREPHMVVMSATPIPRTLALIVYGNMDVSVIDSVPSLRKPIKNAVIDDSYKDNAYKLIEREIRKGRQAYIICPLVEYSEGVEAQNVEDYFQMLGEIFSDDIVIGKLHGQMKPAQKNEIMQRFAAGEIQVLVSTTVVEVGVDVPNATVMMIEDANRFGLAALHQLRGRVGRGNEQSYCMFVCNSNSDQAKERLDILKTSNNGFEIAAKDLEMRGPGEFLGVRQSGEMAFRNFDLYADADIAKKAVGYVNDILSEKMTISEDEKKSLFEKIRSDDSKILL